MNTHRIPVVVIATIALLGATNHAPPVISKYMMERNAEIAFARTAAPASLSSHATIMALTAHGFEVAAKGDNGFTCLVEWQWMHLNNPVAWSTKRPSPVCYNAPASRTVLLYTLKRTVLTLQGFTEAEIEPALTSLPPAAPDSIAYMMSKNQWIDDKSKAWYPHLMFFMPQPDGAKLGLTWGADRRYSPIMYAPNSAELHEPWAKFFIPVSHWSDGSRAPLYDGT